MKILLQILFFLTFTSSAMFLIFSQASAHDMQFINYLMLSLIGLRVFMPDFIVGAIKLIKSNQYE